MNLESILSDKGANYTSLLITSGKEPFKTPLDKLLREYDPNYHKVMDKLYRKDKKVRNKTDKKDINGNPIYEVKTSKVCRTPIPIQRVLVERSVGFIFGIPVSYNCSDLNGEQQKEIYNKFKKIIKDNKMQYTDKNIARRLFSEREVAELWYFVLDNNGKPTSEMRCKILSPTLGDGLYPHFDEYGRMDAFARSYTTRSEYELDKTISHFDIYTNEFVYSLTDEEGKMTWDGHKRKHGFTKIPIGYYRQEEAEWECVQPVIERIEDLLSNWGDINDYFGAPSYFCKGNLTGFADKGEQGRVYTGQGDADMRVLSWDSSPQSMSTELATLTNIVFSYTQTPDISFETMKQLGGQTSGVAIKLMFTDPHMKADVKIELFGNILQRRANIILNGIVSQILPTYKSVLEDFTIEPQFTPYQPKNDKEILDLIQASTGGVATLSQEEGVKLNPLVTNPEKVLSELKEQAEEEKKNNGQSLDN